MNHCTIFCLVISDTPHSLWGSLRC